MLFSFNNPPVSGKKPDKEGNNLLNNCSMVCAPSPREFERSPIKRAIKRMDLHEKLYDLPEILGKKPDNRGQ